MLALPGAAAAQSAATSSNWWYQEGPSEPGAVRQQRVRGYRGQSSELQQKINALGSEATAAVPMPVLFGVGLNNISPNFGDPRSGGRTHEGEDIMAVKGTPIVSPTQAVVLRTGVGPTEGNYVYTANPGGETFVYMHLDRIGEGVVSGQVLWRGSLIGYVGNTGNASGGAAHLHFEIHNSAGTPVDPFPRLTAEIALFEKISSLTTILSQTADPAALAQFVASNFRSTLVAARSIGIIMPVAIANLLGPAPSAQPTGALGIGSTGAAVVALQRQLIQAASGPAATRLASVGATGYFGALTQAALVEYRAGVPAAPATPAVLARDLSRGMTGEDVRTLQRRLNALGYTVAAAGAAGSAGHETTYFGPATEAAVIRFQTSHGILPANGNVGSATRAALAAL